MQPHLHRVDQALMLQFPSASVEPHQTFHNMNSF
jgi:hypothetical protein